MTIGDVCYPDGALKDSFIIGSHRLKGGKPKAPEPPKRPDHYSDACHCPKCTLYDGRRIPKPKQPPAARHLLILPEMKPLLLAWMGQIRARVGEAFGMDTPLWLSRKRGKGGVYRAISRQQYWFIVVEACKKGIPTGLRLARLRNPQRTQNDCDADCRGYRRYHRRAALYRTRLKRHD